MKNGAKRVNLSFSASPSKVEAVSIEDITITEPDLDDVFIHYYDKEGK